MNISSYPRDKKIKNTFYEFSPALFYAYLILNIGLMYLGALSLVTGFDDSVIQQTISIAFLISILLLVGKSKRSFLNLKIIDEDFLWFQVLFYPPVLSIFISQLNGFDLFISIKSSVAIIAVLLIFYTYKNNLFNYEGLSKYLLKWSILYFWNFMIVYLILYYLENLVGINFNFTFGGPLTALSFILLCGFRRYKYATVMALMIFLSGKRNVYFLSYVPFLLYYVINKRDILIKKIPLMILGCLSVGILLYILIVKFEVPLLSQNVIDKIAALNVFADEVDYNRLGSNRFEEITFALEEFERGGYSYLFGAGSGFVYLARFIGGDETLSNLHFTPITLLVKFGILFAIAFYLFLIKYAVRAYKNNNTCETVKLLQFYLIVYIFFYTLTNYGLISDYSFWVVFGIVSNIFIGGFKYGVQQR